MSLLAGGLLLGCWLEVRAQAPPPSTSGPQKAQKKPRAKKVWTEDDLIELRTPSDRYLREKLEQREQEEAAARAAAEAQKEGLQTEEEAGMKESSTPGSGAAPRQRPSVPDNSEALTNRIREVTRGIESLQYQLAGARAEAEKSVEEAQVAANNRVADLSLQLDEAREELNDLQTRLRVLRGGSPNP